MGLNALMRQNPMLFNQVLASPPPPEAKQTSINPRLRSSLQPKPVSSTKINRNQKLNDTLATDESRQFK